MEQCNFHTRPLKKERLSLISWHWLSNGRIMSILKKSELNILEKELNKISELIDLTSNEDQLEILEKKIDLYLKRFEESRQARIERACLRVVK